ncbi:MAG: patatin-like phospholipase family protein [Jatrophihabitantaceae bacterium]
MPATPPRRALVLGGGGVLGFAWMLGALSAVESVAGFEAREADLVLGTSAGAVAAGLLGCGLPVEALCRHHQGVPLPEDVPIAYDYDGTGAALPPRPGIRPAAPRLLLDGIRHPRRTSPIVALSGLLPVGKGTLEPVHQLLDSVAELAGLASGAWPAAPRPWVVAVDYSTGRRVVFGRDSVAPRRDGAPRIVRTASLADAVTASCSIPGWYAPTMIDGVPYVDGGVASNASTDLLLDTAVDEVFVLAPMGGPGNPNPRTAMQRLERVVRRSIARTIAADVAALRARGVRVYALAPEPEDLAVMGLNLMDPAPRARVLETARTTATAQLRRQLSGLRVLPDARSGRASGATG